MDDFKEKMDLMLSEPYDGPMPGFNGVQYSMSDRMHSDLDTRLLHSLNMPLIRHLAERSDYQGLGQYICGMINKQHMDHDD